MCVCVCACVCMMLCYDYVSQGNAQSAGSMYADYRISVQLRSQQPIDRIDRLACRP